MSFKNPLFPVLIFLALPLVSPAQDWQFEGRVTQAEDGKPVPWLNVMLMDTDTSRLIAFSTTNGEGNYRFSFVETGRFLLVFSGLGYETRVIPFELLGEKRRVVTDVELRLEDMELEEVVIETQLPVKDSGDTLLIRTDYFRQGNEQNMEDLFRKLPGITVSPDGAIMFEGKEVEQVMVEGDDFFGRGYRLLSQNMPAYPVEEVQVIKRFAANRLLKNIEDSDKIALNLKLYERFKRVWFGNVQAGYNALFNEPNYAANGNLMNFGKRNKYYLLVNGNNVGRGLSADIRHVIEVDREENRSFDFSGRYNPTRGLMGMLAFNAFPIGMFEAQRTNFNNDQLASANAIFNPSEQLKIKVSGIGNLQRERFDFSRVVENSGGDVFFTNTVLSNLNNRTRHLNASIKTTYDASENLLLELNTVFLGMRYNGAEQQVFNGLPLGEQAAIDFRQLYQQVRLTRRLSEQRALQIDMKFSHDASAQQLTADTVVFAELFPAIEPTGLRQRLSVLETQAVAGMRLLGRPAPDSRYELRAKTQYQRNSVQSGFSLQNETGADEAPEQFQGENRFETFSGELAGEYARELGKNLELTGLLAVRYFHNRLAEATDADTQAALWLNPELKLSYTAGAHMLSAGYTFQTSNIGAQNLLPAYVLVRSNSFQRGTDRPRQLNESGFSLIYFLNKPTDDFYGQIFMNYGYEHQYFITRTLLQQNFSLNDQIVLRGRGNRSLNSTLSYYLSPLASRIKINIVQMQNDFQNLVNGEEVRTVRSINNTLGIEMRSGFTSWFNYHFGTEWINTRSLAGDFTAKFTDNKQFFDILLQFGERYTLTLKTERFFFGNLPTDNTYFFLDILFTSQLIPGKLSLRVSGTNLTGNQRFRQAFASDLANIFNNYRLLNPIALLSLEYRL